MHTSDPLHPVLIPTTRNILSFVGRVVVVVVTVVVVAAAVAAEAVPQTLGPVVQERALRVVLSSLHPLRRSHPVVLRVRAAEW